MPKRILIDATHDEETRVVVLENGRVQEFDSETSIKKQLKGNIYLAKVTRVEPSLQSAFVEYGGDRHGFLPFSEIHPDYYNIPVTDKQALLENMKAQVDREEDESDAEEGKKADKTSGGRGSRDNEEPGELSADDGDVEVIEGEEEELETGALSKSSDLYRKYKIQEVIKRNQIILVQVEKEERGNKGASLTTFISLAGRYCVLMPNALRKGGVSRRVSSYEDRKRLKTVIAELKIPEDTGLIVRTAGAGKEAKDIKDDYNYLANLWNTIRQNTLASAAPAFIHAEGDIVKRTVRDLYSDQIDEVIIEGRKAFETARDFMKIISQEHISKVKEYKNKVPIYTRYRVEEQIAALYRHEAPLESGGAIVINPTEALISIDVNSGKSTTHRNVEGTALSTNLEAAREVARQLRLRDLSGLIVVDFIDMMEMKNRKAVERELKEAFVDDRAKIQIGRISTFGLLEMSRQRLRPSFLETNTMVCPHCEGVGAVKATESTAVTVLRAIESDVSKKVAYDAVDVSVATEVVVYILNNKRAQLSELEKRYNVRVFMHADDDMGAAGFSILPAKDAGKSRSRETKNDQPNIRPVDVASADRLSKDENDTDRSQDAERKSSAKRQKRTRRGDHRRNEVREDADRTKRPALVGGGNILEGLWKKIVD